MTESRNYTNTYEIRDCFQSSIIEFDFSSTDKSIKWRKNSLILGRLSRISDRHQYQDMPERKMPEI